MAAFWTDSVLFQFGSEISGPRAVKRYWLDTYFVNGVHRAIYRRYLLRSTFVRNTGSRRNGCCARIVTVF